MIKSIIVDDEKKGREALEGLLAQHCPEVQVLALADSANVAYEFIIRQEPDLVFLDVEMPFHSGFNLLERFEKINFHVIFTTAYDQYALKAIKFSAIDYLLKPIDPQELKEAVAKIAKKQGKAAIDYTAIQTLLSNLNSSGKNQTIAIPNPEGYTIIKIGEIVSCEASENYTNIKLVNGEQILSSKTLKDYDSILAEHNFFRIHNSTLINISQVKKYIKGDGGYVEMTDGCCYPISRRKKIDFLEKLTLLG